MSEPINPTQSVNPSIPADPVQAPATSLDAPPAEERLRADAKAQLRDTTACVKRAEKGYAAGYLEAGYHASCYITTRLKLGDARSAAVDTLIGQLSEYSSAKVRPGDLIACYHSHRLLAEVVDADNLGNVPFAYGHYANAWKQLVVRQAQDTADESYALLPGLEDECKALFASAVQAKLSRDGCLEKCRALVGQWTSLQVGLKAAAAEQANERKAAAEKAAAEKAAGLAEAKAAADRAKSALNSVGNEQDKAALEAALQAAELAAQQLSQEAKASLDSKTAAIKAAGQAGREAQLAVQRKGRMEQRQVSSKPEPTPVSKPERVDPVAMIRAATLKDAAQLIVRMLQDGGKDAAELLQAVASGLDWNPAMGTALIRGMVEAGAVKTVQAMYMAMAQAAKKAPSSANGQLREPAAAA